MSITKSELENKIRRKIREYVRAKEDGSYLHGSASEGAITELLYKYATKNYKKSETDQASTRKVPDLMYMEQHYGLEILEAARDSIHYYSEDKGDFIHFFNFNLKRRIRIARGKEATAQMSGGMSIPERKAIVMSKARRKLETSEAAEERGKVIINPEDMKQLLDRMYENGEISIVISIEEVSAYLAMKTTSLTIDNGEEGIGEYKRSILDIIGNDSVEETVENRVFLEEVVHVISDEYAKAQERQRGYLREMLTVLFMLENISTRALKGMIGKDCSWFDWDIYDTYIRTGQYPFRSEMSARYGVYEESLSRTLSRFLSKVDAAMRRGCLQG